MNTKTRKKIAEAYINIDFIVMAALSFLIIWYNMIIGLLCMMVVGGVYTFHRYKTKQRIIRYMNEYKDNVLKERGDIMKTFTEGVPVLVCLMNKELDVRWANDEFAEVFESKADLYENFPKDILRKIFENKNETINGLIKSRYYEISYKEMEDETGYLLIFFKDVTELEEMRKKYRGSLVCMAHVNIDNLDEILQAAPIENRSRLDAEISGAIYDWAKEMDASVYKTDDGRYTVIFLHKYLEKQKRDGFPILNKAREIENDADFPTSLSIGVGIGEMNLAGLQEAAMEAVDLALGRGGDQAVVRDEHGETEYYGGLLPSVEKRNKGKSRVMAHALSNHIKDADKVFIVGHSRPDMDSFGSSIGVYAITNNSGKESYIVLEEPGEGIEAIYQVAKRLTLDDGKEAYPFITEKEALELLTSKSLVICTDHHIAAISEAPELCEKAEKIAIIDHHRRSNDCIEKPVLSFMESYASSASELVTEMLQYSGDNGDISKFEAEALLSGIALDTKNFTTNTGVRTFEAASWLKRNGADTNNIKKYFKVDLEFYQKKIHVISNAEILSNGIAVAYTKDIDSAMQIIVSQAADELLSMKGVDAAIAAGSNGERTMVSARSNGKINVQALMEKLGGGGHQQAAAVQLEVGPEVAISQVVQAMRLEGLL